MADPLVTICIPTYNRVDFLSQAIDSCLAQTYTNLEIIVGDDSPSDETAQRMQHYLDAHPGTIRYIHNRPALGQNLNVNSLFALAHGERLVLLHDDDLLLPDALARLAACWLTHPDLDGAFGKQSLIRNDGTPASQAETDALNKGYHRVAANAGLQQMPAAAGITGMFPNDCFMIKTQLARSIGYRPAEEVGVSCDLDFGMRFCFAARQIWFLDEVTARYRLSDESVGKHSLPALSTFKILAELNVPREAEQVWRQAKLHYAPAATSGYAREGKTRSAIKLYLSNDYPMKERVKPRGLYHLLLIGKSLFMQPSEDLRRH